MAVTSSGDGNFSSVIAGGLSVNDDVIINHDVTMDGHAPNVNSLVINSGKTLTGGGYKITIDSENGSGFAVDNDGIISGNLDLEINTQATTQIDLNGSSGNFRDVKLNDASVDARLAENTTIGRNLTIAAGELNTSGSNYSLTVTGKTSISSGTLTLNNSVVLLGTTSTSDYGLTMSGGACNMGGSDCKTGAVNISGGALTPTSATWEVMSAYSSNAWISVPSSFTNQGTLKFTSPLGGNIRTPQGMNDVIFDASSGTPTWTIITQGFQCVNLTITDGTLDTGSDYGLVVTGNTVVDGTLTGNNSTLTFGTNGVHGSTEGGCLLVNSSGTFTFGSGDVTIFSGFTAKGTEGSPNVTSTGGGDIIIKGRTNNGFMNSHSHQGTNITGDYIIDYDATGIFDNRGGTTIACGTFIIKHDGRTYEPWSNSGQDLFKIIGNMQIQDGTFDTEYSGQNSQHLTVTGKVDIDGGALTLNASTVNIGNLDQSGGTINGNTSTINLNTGTTGGWVWYRSGGTWNYNTSTVVYKENGKHMEGEFYNLIIECASSTHTGVWRADGIASTIMKCANNLTVKEGIWKRDSASETMTIEKNVVIEDGGTLGQTSATGADNFGSLTIENNGTYVATSGTTSITGGASVTTNRCMKVSTNGVYTLNNGTINVTGTDWGGTNYAHLWVPDGFDFGNVTINAGGADSKYYQFREGSGTMNFNNVYCKSGEWRDYNNNNTFNIRGNLDIGTRGAGGTNAALFGSDARDNANTTKLIVGGLVTNYTNGQFHVPYGTDGTDGCKIGGLRNTGGTVYGDTA